MSTFKFAGVSKHDEKFKFRATNRDGYADILIKEGKTDVNIQTLPTPMDKDAAKAFLAAHSEFQDAEIQAVLVGKPAKEAKPAKEPKAPKAKKVKETVTPLKTDDEIAAIKERNMATLKAVGARLAADKAADEERRQELATIEAEYEEEDIKDIVPKFLHTEMGIE